MKTASIITTSIMTGALACAGLSGTATAQTRQSSVRGHSPAVGTPAGETTGKSARTIRASSGGGKPHAQRTMKNGGRPVSTSSRMRKDTAAARR